MLVASWQARIVVQEKKKGKKKKSKLGLPACDELDPLWRLVVNYLAGKS